MQTPIRCMLMRGGTSKGAYFLSADLPDDIATRDRVLLCVMGSMGADERQIDGIGGADPLTSKVAIIGPPTVAGADLDYLFLQVLVGEERVDTTPNCGNMLSGVGAFALERRLVEPLGTQTTLRIHMVNSGMLCAQTVQTPAGHIEYQGTARIDGVPGTAAPVLNEFLNTAGSACGALLPTGNSQDLINGVAVTAIDNGMPVVLIRAEDLNRTGYEDREYLNNDEELKAKLESIRLQIGPMMNLGDVRAKVVPKMTLIAPPKHGGTISTRCFIPHTCHASIGVLAAVTVATACVLPETVAAGVAVVAKGAKMLLSIEHPSGELSVALEADATGAQVKKSSLLRTTRAIFDGYTYVPRAVWAGQSNPGQTAK